MTETLHSLNLSTLLATVAAVCQVCAGIPGPLPQPAGAPFVFPEVNPLGGAPLPSGQNPANTGARLTYDVVSIIGLGYDEFRRDYDPDATPITEATDGDTYRDAEGNKLGAVIENVSGNRQVIVQVRAEVPAAGLGAANAAAAFDLLERVRTRMYMSSIGDVLDAAGFAISNIADSRPADFTDDSGFTQRAAYLEITFNSADVASDDPTTTIEILNTPEKI